METLQMSAKERARLEVFGRVKAGDITLVKASEILGMSYRQVKRSWARYQALGAVGLVHRLRGRSSNRQADPAVKEKALTLYREKYGDYGPTLAAECLAAEDGVSVPVETLRGWLLGAGLWQRQRRRREHRRRRPRKEQFGEMVQMDGSVHPWFEGRRGEAVLMVLIDDATGRVYARFYERETVWAAWDSMRGWIERYGVPRSLYVDRHSIYRSDAEPTAEQLLSGEEPPTQFGRSMEELGVRLIRARSPQAKGRVERMNRTLQDRLVKALRRAGISDLGEANRFLEEEFLPALNKRFAVSAAVEGDLHRPLEAGYDLDRAFSVQERRVVRNDWTVRWGNRFLQLERSSMGHVRPGGRVTVCEQGDGRIRVFTGEVELAWSETRSEASRGSRRAARGREEIRSSQGNRPSEDHPWRKFRFGKSAVGASGDGGGGGRSESGGSASDSLRSSSAPPPD